jgi:hypothetical protein
MTKEQRTIVITLLVCFIYGFSFWMQQGVFIIPTPLFPLFSLIAGGYICYLNYQKNQVLAILTCASLFIDFACSGFAQSIVFNEITITNERHLFWIEFSMACSLLLFFCTGMLFLIQQNNVIANWISLFYSCLFAYAFINNSLFSYLLSISLLIGYSIFSKKTLFPLHLIALLLLTLRGAELLFQQFIN